MAIVLDSKVGIREMVEDDLPDVIELSVEQAWPHRMEDWQLLLAVGEGIVAERFGRIVGCTMGWPYGADYATIGMVIVQEDERGRGTGRTLMEAMLTRFEGRSIMLNATVQGIPLYEKLGFAPVGRIVQHQGPAPEMPLAHLGPAERVRPMGAGDEALCRQYSAATGIDRTVLLGALVKASKAIVLERNYKPAGFALLRKFGRGRAVAPVIAPDLGGAKVLASHWLGANLGAFCRIDAVAQTGLSEWLEKIGLPAVGSVVTMVRGKRPRTGAEHTCYAISSQAFG